MRKDYINAYKEYLRRWRRIKDQGDPVWTAVYKNGQPILIKKDGND